MQRFLQCVLFLSFCLGGINHVQAEEFKLRAGDVLQVTVWKEEGMDRELVVLPDGTISFPLIGTIALQDKTLAQAQEAIKTKLANMVPDASVTVMVRAPLGHTVSVLGQVLKPGEIVMGQQLGVMQALSQAGGVTPYADTDDIVVLRKKADGQKESLPYPYDDIVQGKKMDKDIELLPGDVVFVPTSGLF